ncbi:MAG: hypothetical protein IPO21_00575 [Bacteroidales bacterium]|nr:hypothetical protein [Bacteroidales bacterium]
MSSTSKIFLFVLIFIFSLTANAQVEDLYKLYRQHEYEKCLKKSQVILEKDQDLLEAYWVNALVYFEMAQKPDKWISITNDPLDDCLKNLGKIKSKDSDASFYKEREDTLQFIKEFANDQIAILKEKGLKTSTAKLYKLIFKAFQGEEDALQLAHIYILSEDYMQCIVQIDKIYSTAPPDVVPSSTADPKALNEGIKFMIENFMFKDAFKMIEKYKDKFSQNTYINNAFKNAVLLAVDTLFTNKDKALFFEYSERGKSFYGDDLVYIKHLENLCIKLIKQSETAFFEKKKEERTWRDTLNLRDAFKYADMAQLLLPNNTNIKTIEKNLIEKYNCQIPDALQLEFKKAALDVINKYRYEGYYCDSIGQVPSLDSVVWNNTLAYLASIHAKDMFAYNYTGSVNRRGLDLKGRIDETELKGTKAQTFGALNFVGALKFGENIGYGVTFISINNPQEYKKTIDKMVSNWMIATRGGSCERIMEFDYTDCGLGFFGDRWVLIMAYVLNIKD